MLLICVSPATNSALLSPRHVQTAKKASGLSGKVVLLVSSEVVPNSDLPLSRTSISKKYVIVFAMRGTGVLITTAVRLHMVSPSHQFLPVSGSIYPDQSVRSFGRYFSHLYSTPGPSRRRRPSWRLRSRRHDWKTSRGYARGTHSRSCWTCRETFRHRLHSFLVDSGWYYDDRWIPPPDLSLLYSRIYTANVGLFLPHHPGDFTPASVGVATHSGDCSYVMMRN